MKPMPPTLRRLFRPAMTRLVVGFLLSVVGGCCYFHAVYAHYRVGGHAPDDPPNVAIVLAAIIAIPAGIVACFAAWKLIRAGLFTTWNWWG